MTAVAVRSGERDEAVSGRPSLAAFALGAVGATVESHAQAPSVAAELRYLLERLRSVVTPGRDWRSALEAYLDRPNPEDGALLALAERLRLAPVETLAVQLAATVERDVMAGRAVAHVQAPLGGSRPTLGLIATAFAPLAPPGLGVAETIVTGAAVRTGLLSLSHDAAPLPERVAGVPLHLCLALEGHDGAPPGASIGTGPVAAVPLPASVVRDVERQAAALVQDDGRVLQIRTGSPSEARSIAAALAGALGARAAFLDPERAAGVGPWLLLRRLLPVFAYELGPGERRTLPSLPGYDGPRIALLGPDGSVDTAEGSVLGWRVGVPRRDERVALWRQALGDEELAAELGRRYRQGSGRIAHLGRLARHRQAIARRRQPTPEDVTHAAWTLEGAGLETLAEPLPETVPTEALVLPKPIWDDLRQLVLRSRWRGELVDGLGASARARYRPGVRALFVGPSGTGKTLAAGWLATQLGLPLYRVDLASVTSKYIGETEKNLAQLLARAEQAEVVLLFDEADSMFGKRTDVKDANDRFANAQTNYLLQRIESFDGIALLTSNSRARFDSGFMRRLDLILEFPLPGPEQRRALWYSHLGEGHQCTAQQVNELAARVDLGGGHIRNAVLAAAVRAREGNERIGFADLLAGVAAEYRKLGRQLPAELRSFGADRDRTATKP